MYAGGAAGSIKFIMSTVRSKGKYDTTHSK